MPFTKSISAKWKIKTVLSRIWTQNANSISYNHNYYTKHTLWFQVF